MLEDSLRQRKYRPGEQIPGERELAKSMQVSQMTVNKAIQSLVEDGFLIREMGKGTFVASTYRPGVPDVIKIGFAIPTPVESTQVDHYLAPIIRGMQREAMNYSAQLVIAEAPRDKLYERTKLLNLDGFILTDVVESNRQDILKLASERHKLVLLGTAAQSMPVPSIDSDNFEGTKLGLQHLFDMGHTRIAGVFAYVDSSNTKHRIQAYKDAMHERRSRFNESYILKLGMENPTFEPLHEMVFRLLKSESPPTAFFCGGYYLALETMRAIRETGLRIPEDISVVGYDDPISAIYLTPPLTTVFQPLEEMGIAAVKLLLNWIHNEDDIPEKIMLPSKLIVRGTTAPLPYVTPVEESLMIY